MIRVRTSAGYSLAVITFIDLFNYLNRWVVAAVVESIKRSELHLTDTELGLVGTGFIFVYTLTSPIFGSLGDRKARPPLIALGVAVWSVATGLAGFARGFWTLFAARSAVGVGEAAYGTIAPALIADLFPLEKRGRVFACFFAAIPIGSAAGYVLGGLVDKHYGWRAAFWMFDPPRGVEDGGPPLSGQPRAAVVHTYAHLLKNTPYMLTVLGYGAYTFALGGLAFWMPAFLERVRGLPRSEATVTFGVIALATGFAGTFAGGWLGDLGLRWTKQSYLWVSGISTLLAAPVTWVALTNPKHSVYITAIVIAELLIFMSTGPVNSAIVNAVAPAERATALGMSIFVMHLVGDIPSPPLIGKISDATSLERAFLIVPVAIVIGGLIWTFAAWRGREA